MLQGLKMIIFLIMYYTVKYKIRKFDFVFTNNKHNKRNTLPHKLYFYLQVLLIKNDFPYLFLSINEINNIT